MAVPFQAVRHSAPHRWQISYQTMNEPRFIPGHSQAHRGDTDYS